MKHFSLIDLPNFPNNIIKEIKFLVTKIVHDIKKNNTIDEKIHSWWWSEENKNEKTLFYHSKKDLITSIEKKHYDEDDICYFLEYTYRYPKNFQDWIKQNVSQNCVGKIFFMFGGKIILPHIDGQRNNNALNYVIEKGGTDVVNKFWRPKKEFLDYEIKGPTYCCYDKIEQIGELHVENNNWYQFDSGQIHSIENLNPDKIRIIITISSNWHKDKLSFESNYNKPYVI